MPWSSGEESQSVLVNPSCPCHHRLCLPGDERRVLGSPPSTLPPSVRRLPFNSRPEPEEGRKGLVHGCCSVSLDRIFTWYRAEGAAPLRKPVSLSARRSPPVPWLGEGGPYTGRLQTGRGESGGRAGLVAGGGAALSFIRSAETIRGLSPGYGGACGGRPGWEPAERKQAQVCRKCRDPGARKKAPLFGEVRARGGGGAGRGCVGETGSESPVPGA